MKSPSRLIIQVNLLVFRILLLIFIAVLVSSAFSSFVRNAVAGQGGLEGNLSVGDTGGYPLTSIDEVGDANGYSRELKKTIPVIPDYSLTIGKSGSGSGTITGPEIECGTTCYGLFPQGTVIELSAAPDTGSSFAGWSGGGCAGMFSCSIAMNAATEVTAIFRKVITISLVTDNHGKIAPIGRVSAGLASTEAASISMFSVDSGSSQTFRINPDPGCHLSSILVDGVSVEISNTYIFRDIAGDHTITATFAPDSRAAADVDDGRGCGSR